MINKVILIDDDPLSIYLTRFVLQQVQFAETIETYQEAKQALYDLLANMAGSLPEVIFLDLNMPEMDGWDFLQALQPREQELAGRVKIYILTSSVDRQDQQIADEYPLVAGVLLKPFDAKVAATLKQEVMTGKMQ
jgi:two-component system, chemotaxis family, chemotaxis protein CheY